MGTHTRRLVRATVFRCGERRIGRITAFRSVKQFTCDRACLFLLWAWSGWSDIYYLTVSTTEKKAR